MIWLLTKNFDLSNENSEFPEEGPNNQETTCKRNECTINELKLRIEKNTGKTTRNKLFTLYRPAIQNLHIIIWKEVNEIN